MKQEHIEELHAYLENFFKKHDYDEKHVFAFLTITLVGTFEMHGVSEEKFDAVCERMKENFWKKRSMNKNLEELKKNAHKN